MYIDYYGKKWFKGNLHTHTTESDGALSPEETVERYRYAGYDFLAITDHFMPGIYESISETMENPEFLVLSGVEYGTNCENRNNDNKHSRLIHINGIGFTAPPEYSPDFSAQEIVDAIHQKDGIAIFDHPVWSRNLPEDVLTAEGYDGLEIYNSAASAAADSSVVVDMLAYHGLLIPVVAADDTHFFTGEEFGGFIMVQADSLNRNDILHAIREKRFFASRGPWVQARIEGNFIHVECTPVCNIKLYSNMCGVMSVTTGQKLTGAKFDMTKIWWMPAGAYYFRVEVIDKDGKSAWTNPAPFENQEEEES